MCLSTMAIQICLSHREAPNLFWNLQCKQTTNFNVDVMTKILLFSVVRNLEFCMLKVLNSTIQVRNWKFDTITDFWQLEKQAIFFVFRAPHPSKRRNNQPWKLARSQKPRLSEIWNPTCHFFPRKNGSKKKGYDFFRTLMSLPNKKRKTLLRHGVKDYQKI